MAHVVAAIERDAQVEFEVTRHRQRIDAFDVQQRVRHLGQRLHGLQRGVLRIAARAAVALAARIAPTVAIVPIVPVVAVVAFLPAMALLPLVPDLALAAVRRAVVARRPRCGRFAGGRRVTRRIAADRRRAVARRCA
ncbi:MAG: hypothetical protein INH34_12215 [Phycisphaerales bacterium]|nr:hypothetical protein [Phycisphaerales bacterium]